MPKAREQGNSRKTEPVVLVGARTDPNEHEGVVLQLDLDALVLTAG
jgi:uncharacterized RmlC-like cupin family protein